MSSQWTEKTYVNEFTGAQRKTWRKSTYTAAGHKVLYEVYQLDGRYYWSANIMIAYRPDLSQLAYGTYLVTPHSLAVAKTRATRLGTKALRDARTPRHLTRAA